MTHSRRLALTSSIVFALVFGALAPGGSGALAQRDQPQRGQPPSGGAPDMHANLERTIFKANVLSVTLIFDPATKGRIQAAARGPGDADAKANAIARAAVDADQVTATIYFKRHVPLPRFIDAVRDDLAKAEHAGMIDPALRAKVSNGLPRWFTAVRERGFADGDRIVYSGNDTQLHTRVVADDGTVLVDQIDPGDGPKRALLAGYFAPGSTFREPLVESVRPSDQ